jgi:hypothetical protein
MSKSNMKDGHADAFAAAALICVALVWVSLWLNGMPA